MRHVNRPIYSDISEVTNPARPETAYYGSFTVRTAGTIEANFPWVEKDTINTCTGKIDSDGRLIVGDYGREEEMIPTSYAYDSRGNVGRYGRNYVYMYQNNRLVRFDGYMTQNFTDKKWAQLLGRRPRYQVRPFGHGLDRPEHRHQVQAEALGIRQ